MSLPTYPRLLFRQSEVRTITCSPQYPYPWSVKVLNVVWTTFTGSTYSELQWLLWLFGCFGESRRKEQKVTSMNSQVFLGFIWKPTSCLHKQFTVRTEPMECRPEMERQDSICGVMLGEKSVPRNNIWRRITFWTLVDFLPLGKINYGAGQVSIPLKRQRWHLMRFCSGHFFFPFLHIEMAAKTLAFLLRLC